MEEVAEAAGSLTGLALERATTAERAVQAPTDFDPEQGWARFNQLMSGAEANV